MRKFYILLPLIFLSSCTYMRYEFGVGFGESNQAGVNLDWQGYVRFTKLKQDERVLFLKESSRERSDIPVVCMEPPLSGPAIGHAAFEVCQAYANRAIGTEEYKDLLETAMSIEKTSILADAALRAATSSGISEERAEKVTRLIYDIYGSKPSSPTESDLPDQ